MHFEVKVNMELAIGAVVEIIYPVIVCKIEKAFSILFRPFSVLI